MPTLKNLRCAFFVLVVLSACLLSGLGCGGSEKVVSVSGKVTRNGKPVDGLIVSFVPVAQTATGTSTGETDENGQYELTVARTGRSGAVVGTHKVWLSLPRTPPEPFEKDDKARIRSPKKKAARATELPPDEVAAILKKYGKLDKTPLTMEVTGNGPIDLKLD
jgi:hypothetical protein